MSKGIGYITLIFCGSLLSALSAFFLIFFSLKKKRVGNLLRRISEVCEVYFLSLPHKKKLKKKEIFFNGKIYFKYLKVA